MRALWPPDEEQATKLGPPPPCRVCGGPTYWDQTWDEIFMAWCTKNALVYSAYAYAAEGLTVHRRRRYKQRKE